MFLRDKLAQGITVHCFFLLISCNLLTKVAVTKNSLNQDMALVNANKSVKKPQKQRYVVGMGPQSGLSMLEITCVQEISLALIHLNILGKASVSVQEVAESVQAQGCCIKMWKWKQKLACMLGNTSDLML